MLDLISIGDTAIDTFIPLIDADIENIKGERKLLFEFGGKIPAEQSVSIVAGNAANNAIGSARLNLKTAIYTNVGKKDEDEADHRIIAKFKKEGVDIRYVFENRNLPSNHNIVLTFQNERTILVHHQPWKYDLPDLDRSRWVYLTSLSPSYSHSSLMQQLINYLERSKAKLAYQPGTFQIKQGIKKQTRLLSLCEIFIVNLEEAKLILGFSEGENVPIKKLLTGLVDLGPKMVVITDGGEGSFGFDGEKYYKLGIFPAKLVEMTGAGDAFATGVVAGLMHGKALSETMRWGAANAASVVEYIGSQAGLLTLSQMEEKLKLNSKVVAKEI